MSCNSHPRLSIAMDFGFSDELSEDWISQPASAAPSLRGNDSFEGSVATSAASHGVHPKPLALVHVPAKTGTASIRKHTGPLQEKTSSDINVAKQDPPGKDSLRSSARVAVSEKKRSLQNDGSEYVADGTVQVAASPPKDRVERGATPEWRRRLINGQRSVGEQQDFFSPRGIERIFNKPDENDTPSGTPTKSPRQKKSMLPTPVRGSSPAVSWKPREDAKAPTRPEQRGSPSQIPRALRRDAIEPGQASPLPARAIPTITPPALPLKALRVRSRTVSGMQRTSREEELGASDRSPSERPSSRSSDSVLYNNHKSVEFPRAERGSRSASHQSAKEAWLSRSTNYITTSRGNADADDTFFLHSLSQISFADDAVLAVGSRQDHKQDVLNVPKSPLKLFAEDDSFTSKRLHRRVSQLEYDHPISNTDHLEGDALQSKKSVERRRVSNFGAGELDRYPFEPEDSMQDMPLLDMARIGDTTLSKRERILQHRSTSAAFGAPEQLESEYEQLDSDKLEHTEKKRFLAPPRRVSLAKRRRTSDHEQESRESSAGDRLVVSGRKRKDARYEDPPASTPEAIASRRRLVAVGQSRRMTSRSQLAAVLLEEDTYEEGQGSRKKSLTTADFFNEANAIMQKIRAQDHPRSSLASFKPLSSVASDPGSSILHEEFTIEQLSRPASWEGNEQRKQFTPRTLDARVVSHLRKFEDNDDLDFEWSSSPKPRSEAVEEDSATVERDPPNVRIRERNSELQHVEQAQQQTTQDKSRPSTQSSSSNSVPTGSSHGSAGRATISPDKVSHLINLTMGGMTFDQTRLCWVKQRASRPSSNLTEAVHSDPSEEDPLCNIPDLSVNESLEIRTTRKQAVFHKASSPLHELDLLPHTALEDQDVDQEANEESSIASDVHRFTSSGPTVETRATSWGDLPPRPAPGKVSVAIPSLTQLPHRDITDERSSQNDGKSRNTIRSHATQALSTCPEENGSKQDMTSGPEQDQPQGHRGACAEDEIDRKAPKGSSTPDGKPLKEPRDALDRSLIRAEDIPPLEILQVTSPLTSAHERDQSMQLTVSTPQPRHIAGMKPRHTPAGHLFHYEPMHLTPLPDFTVNQPDESLNLDMNYVAQRRGLSSVPEIEKNFSLAIEDLVGKITDIEPHEPYWEYMRVLDLKGQRLWTLHMLADFCGRIEELEISDNELGQLNGAPRTLRVLSAARNRLSGLTAWQHVPNLQYLDVSYNHISTLTSFSCLIHLRELNIEDNGIENLDGIQGLSGLISLKLGRNALKRLDFQVVQMLVFHNPSKPWANSIAGGG